MPARTPVADRAPARRAWAHEGAPPVANGLVTMPVRWRATPARRHLGRATRRCRQASVLGAPGLHVVDVVLQVLPTPGSAWATAMPWRCSSACRPMPESSNNCGEPKAPPHEHRLAPRHLPELAAVVVGDARGAPAVGQVTRAATACVTTFRLGRDRWGVR